MKDSQFKKAVFLDRDGVINKVIFRDGKLSAARNFGELKILPGVKEAIAILHQAGFLCVAVTNQPEFGRGLPPAELERMHVFLKSELKLDRIYACTHGKSGDCGCFKPQPGMVEQAVSEFGIDLKQSFVVGDRWRDMDLGKNVGCRTALVISDATNFDKERNDKEIKSDFTANNLLEAARLIIG